jgi:voltage-gated potassium channel
VPYSQLVNKRKRRTSIRKSIRIMWRDTSALWSEFRIPILLFMLVALGGGWVYGELYYIARGEYIALIDRPYLMLQLMILETPEEAPPEWYLVVFWYLLPVIFVFIVGLGAADFLYLFFNRGERQDKWMEAIASTYRNHFIVFGAGHVGVRVVRVLIAMDLEVVVIDNDPDPGLIETLNGWRVPVIIGEGRSNATLEKAGLRHANSFVVCTGNDHVNLEAVMKVRDFNPDIRIVVRVWDDTFAKQMKNFMNVQTVLSSSDLAAPAFAGAAMGIEITQTIKVGGVDYSTIRLTVAEGSFMAGRTVGELQSVNDMDIVLYCNGGSPDVQPSRNIVINVGDILVIFAQHDRVIDVAARNHMGVNGKKRRRA